MSLNLQQNEAFSTFLTNNGFATVNDVPVDVLKNIVLNHVLQGQVASASLSTTFVNTTPGLLIV